MNTNRDSTKNKWWMLWWFNFVWIDRQKIVSSGTQDLKIDKHLGLEV